MSNSMSHLAVRNLYWSAFLCKLPRNRERDASVNFISGISAIINTDLMRDDMYVDMLVRAKLDELDDVAKVVDRTFLYLLTDYVHKLPTMTRAPRSSRETKWRIADV